MRSLVLLLVALYCCGLILSMELNPDPGFLNVANFCDPSYAWGFRADFSWNNTDNFFDSRCEIFLELPTAKNPPLTKGNQTNINHAIIPPLPTTTNAGVLEFSASAAVVDMNTACRAAFWLPFDITNKSATVQLSLQLWSRSNDGISQILGPSSTVPSSNLLEYLPTPDGMLSTFENTFGFPVPEITNQLRIDILSPGDFWSRAFSVASKDILMNVPLPGFDSGYITPSAGTNGTWVSVNADLSSVVSTPGTYALRIASTNSEIGGSWGIGNLHLTTVGGIVPVMDTHDVVVDRATHIIGGYARYTKTFNPEL